MRSVEASRPDTLFDDPMAGVFASASGLDLGLANQAAKAPGASDFVALRTRLFDDVARDGCAAGARQVVLLAAGLDVRAYRIDWPPGVRLFELDLPPMFAFKEPLLAAGDLTARCDRVPVAVDLRDDWATSLTDVGFVTDQPTVWIAEGLLPYLEHAAADRLLGTVDDLSAPGSRVCFDYLNGTATDSPALRLATDSAREMGTDLQSTQDPDKALAKRGWQTDTYSVPDLVDRYDRPLPPGSDLTAMKAAVFATASRN